MSLLENKIYVFDIDGTICSTNEGINDYVDSIPFLDRIEKINKLYEAGNTIYFMTARGMGRHNNDYSKSINQFYNFTIDQLNNWGVKFHKLFLGKPAADFYIDDKGINDSFFFDEEIIYEKQ